MAKIPKLPDFTVLPDLDVDFPENCQFCRFWQISGKKCTWIIWWCCSNRASNTRQRSYLWLCDPLTSIIFSKFKCWRETNWKPVLELHLKQAGLQECNAFFESDSKSSNNSSQEVIICWCDCDCDILIVESMHGLVYS